MRGLIARPELNGRHGFLEAYIAEKGRWQVDLDDGAPSMLLKEDNLEWVFGFGQHLQVPGGPSPVQIEEDIGQQLLADLQSSAGSP